MNTCLWLVYTGHLTWILASDWLILITWPKYWSLIGLYWPLDLNTGLWLPKVWGYPWPVGICQLFFPAKEILHHLHLDPHHIHQLKLQPRIETLLHEMKMIHNSFLFVTDNHDRRGNLVLPGSDSLRHSKKSGLDPHCWVMRSQYSKLLHLEESPNEP